jgi:hypothetical protein
MPEQSGRRGDRGKRESSKPPAALAASAPAESSPEGAAGIETLPGQMLDSEKVLELLAQRPASTSASDRSAIFAKMLAPASSDSSLIDAKKLDKSL